MKSTFALIAFLLLAITSADAQMFESQCTKYTGDIIVKRLYKANSTRQIAIRDSVLASRTDSVETFFDKENLGLIVYKNNKPWELIGFWDKDGNPIAGGSLKEGNGTVVTPLPSKVKQVYQVESVPYVNGEKTGNCFYWCDCKEIFCSGYYDQNSKQGEWTHYEASGALLPKKEKIKVDDKINIDWKNVGHCMARPDYDIKPPIEKHNHD